MRLIVRTEAEADIAAGYEWYEEQRAGVGFEFVDEVSTIISTIQAELASNTAAIPTAALIADELTPTAKARGFPHR